MGNQSSINNNIDNDTLGLKNVNLDDVSSTLPGGYKLGKQVNDVINNVPMSVLQSGGNILKEDDDSEDSIGLSRIFQKMEAPNDEEDNENQVGGGDVSDSSPFISSEMYQLLMKGGAKKSKSKSKSSKKYKAMETSETTESEVSLSDDEVDEKDSDEKESDDYQSSSAHEDNNNDDDDDDMSEKKDKKHQKSKHQVPSEVNTSDIKMVTE
jgi:hypothetical protein